MKDYETIEYWKEVSSTLAYMLYQVMEGDIADDVYETLKEFNFIDENYEWNYEE